jgi:hypothetical protein
MERSRVSEHSPVRREEGIALIVTLMIMMLVSVLMVGFVTAVVADQRASGLDRDQTQAYAAAHAGLEQLTSDLSGLFTSDFSPNSTQLNALTATVPSLTGFTFVAPGSSTSGSGYRITWDPDGSGNPRPEDPVNGSPITAGPYQGFRGIITPYDITVTARSRGGAEVRMRRTLQTVAIPVFQFGMFSETDLAFHSGEAYTMQGRVHTNGNLYLAEGSGNTLTITDRITAVGEVVRSHLPNGYATSSSYTGTVRIPKTIAANPASNVYRNLAANEGSLTGDIGSSQNEPKWTQLSIGTYVSNIRNGRTGARALNLPLVADLDGDGNPDAQPIELIRRPATANENTAQPTIFSQRFFTQASLRILLSDTAADITGLPTVTGTAPILLSGPVNPLSGSEKVLDYGVSAPDAWRSPLGNYETPALVPVAPNYLPANVTKGQHNEPVLGGYIKIEMQRQNNTWVDVTREIMGLGISARNLADANEAVATRWNNIPDTAQPTPIPVAGTGDICAEPHPNAVIRLQRVRDIPNSLAPCGIDTDVAGDITGNVLGVSQNEHDYWPLALYDSREGSRRDGLSDSLTDLELGGVIHYVELDVRNLKRWLVGQIGTSGTQARNDNGFIVYFSDRRNNRNEANRETGEYGWEDVVNPGSSTGAPNDSLDAGEDVNGNGTLDFYGRIARNVPGVPIAPMTGASTVTTLITGSNTALIARANRTMFFRRALKIVNGRAGTGGTNPPPAFTAGLTITAENPVYLQGDYNVDPGNPTNLTAAGIIPSAVIADTVTLLSNNWNDIRSFMSPGEADSSWTTVAQYRRLATTTTYRLAIVSGKSRAFPQPSGTSASFGSDGGAHNFLRNLEDWNATNVTQRYRGSLVSFFTSRQATGTFKCCSYDVYHQPDIRDFSFDTDFLLPARLPPGTPMFRDVNTLTFRQLLRPTQ